MLQVSLEIIPILYFLKCILCSLKFWGIHAAIIVNFYEVIKIS